MSLVHVYAASPVPRLQGSTISMAYVNIKCQSFCSGSTLSCFAATNMDTQNSSKYFTFIERNYFSLHAALCIATVNISKSAMQCPGIVTLVQAGPLIHHVDDGKSKVELCHGFLLYILPIHVYPKLVKHGHSVQHPLHLPKEKNVSLLPEKM